MGLELDFKERRGSKLSLYPVTPPCIEIARQPMSFFNRLFLFESRTQMHEQGVGVTVDDPVPLTFQPVPALGDDLMSTPGDAAGKTGIVKTAAV